ncbi:CAP-associated domain-containing protein [Isobaculum melis]|uniref:CAP-associated N-terminal n=1 Tax=Isobaculum melis TaxID=142588 RepID=A0A1H9RU90_9LACT|nr:CAP-associated domain-containing protein [Isobaculum melis]SER76430.1 CAP-associated N-terminal [Isobaculum melis]
MKNIVRAIPLFLIFMWFAYFSPYFGPDHSKKNEEPATKQTRQVDPTGTNMTVLPTNGFAQYIGKDFSVLENEFGQPDRVDETAYGYQSYIYAKDPQHYLQVGVKEHKVVTIYALGTALDVAPFQMDMYLDDLYSIITIVPEVAFKYEQNNYQLELTEEDMNYLPLVCFENESYAALEIDSQTNQVVSLRYFDKETLLRVAPYDVSGLNQLEALPTIDAEEWKKIDESNRKQTMEIFNVIRQRAQLPEFTTTEAIDLICKMYQQQIFHESPKEADLKQQLTDLFTEHQIKAQRFSYFVESIKPDAPSVVDKVLRTSAYHQQLFDPQLNHFSIHFLEDNIFGLFVQSE